MPSRDRQAPVQSPHELPEALPFRRRRLCSGGCRAAACECRQRIGQADESQRGPGRVRGEGAEGNYLQECRASTSSCRLSTARAQWARPPRASSTRAGMRRSGPAFDGWNPTKKVVNDTVKKAGVVAFCKTKRSVATYAAFYEMYPACTPLDKHVVVHAGETGSA